MSDKKFAIRRLQKEVKMMKDSQMQHVIAFPSENDFFIWLFVIFGMEGDYQGGIYMGKILFPPNYPFKPCDIIFITPNGRFATNRKICLSFTSYHPEAWANWSIEGLLMGLVSFFITDNQTTGSIVSSQLERKQLAQASLGFNLQRDDFKKSFREYYDKMNISVQIMREREKKAEELQNEIVMNTGWMSVKLVAFVLTAFMLYKLINYFL